MDKSGELPFESISEQIESFSVIDEEDGAMDSKPCKHTWLECSACYRTKAPNKQLRSPRVVIQCCSTSVHVACLIAGSVDSNGNSHFRCKDCGVDYKVKIVATPTSVYLTSVERAQRPPPPPSISRSVPAGSIPAGAEDDDDTFRPYKPPGEWDMWASGGYDPDFVERFDE